MANAYKRKSALAANMDNPAAVLEQLIAHDLGERAKMHITPQEMLMSGTKKMKKKLKERMELARLNGGMVGKKRPWLADDADLDDEGLDPLGLKRKRTGGEDEDDEAQKRNGAVRGATWLNNYLNHVDFIDNIQLERMAKAQAELQLRNEIGLSRRPHAFDPTWGRGDPYGESAQKGLDVFNSMSPHLVTHRAPAAVASSQYPHASWCVGHMCGMTCNPEAAKQLKQAQITERKEQIAEARKSRMQYNQDGSLAWGEYRAPEKTKLDAALEAAREEAAGPRVPARKVEVEKTGPCHAITAIRDVGVDMYGGAGYNTIESRTLALAPGLAKLQREKRRREAAAAEEAAGGGEEAEC
eukprot:TRINITY_DN35415_c0_g1_i1.p2 TRINITY_DN35415_c0_g1~~TRINITY_DN35415_c0_g1_i1.p2  ORF type:complete len:382 (+),score=122.69 TRINITY_DN35415_c0_g1_i1:83-1147(+)